MKVDELAVPGAWVCTPTPYSDDRGRFLEWFRSDLLAEVTGRRFDVAQANHSTSRRGVVRGVHFADVPPGQAKYVYCTSGGVLDVVIDLRVGSPSFGSVDSVLLDATEPRGVFISEGLGHLLYALHDETSVTYLTSHTYDPTTERAVCPLDPALRLSIPTAPSGWIVSERDAAAPTLDEALKAGILPTYEACRDRYTELGFPRTD
jgi:dTDP-4-dehydrorhamnose 3,5-epimerase